MTQNRGRGRCVHNQGRHSTQVRNGEQIVVSQCRRFKRCVETQKQLEIIGPETHAACEGCKSFVESGRRQCRHLGEVVRYQTADLCGMKGTEMPVHKCNHPSGKHEECTVGRICQKQTIWTCAGCGEFEPTIQRHFYRSMEDVWRDAWAWSLELPQDIVGFCGVHRSGIPIAHALAAHRNVHFVDWHALVNNDPVWLNTIRRRLGKPHSKEGFVLVVDDTSWSGGTFRADVKPLLRDCNFPVKYGAMYFGERGRSEIDYGFKLLPHVRQTYQFNLFHDAFTRQQTFDLDGVFLSDCPSVEIDHDETRYLEWMRDAKPLIVPTHPVGAIVTGRLEKYRAQTMEWLARSGIHYQRLEMYPHAQSNRERNSKHHTVPEWKADVYQSMTYSTLFVESDQSQARVIAEKTGKSVLAYPSQITFNCD